MLASVYVYYDVLLCVYVCVCVRLSTKPITLSGQSLEVKRSLMM